MTSMRKLRRRLLRWRRYAARIRPATLPPRQLDARTLPRGYARTQNAIDRLHLQRYPYEPPCEYCLRYCYGDCWADPIDDPRPITSINTGGLL